MSTFLSMQSVRKQLMAKYDNKFNFYFVKPINEIVQNETTALSTLIYKDHVIFADHNEYLKRIYYLTNTYGRNQIHDRIAMLAQFYDTTVLVKYQHPLMILTNTKHIFLKRIKRMKKMVASDCSSQESSSKFSQQSSPIEFQSSGFLHTVKTSELSQSSNSIKQEPVSSAKSFDNSLYDIFQENVFDFSETIYQPELKPLQVELDCSEDKSTLNHLIYDLDHVDKQKVLKEYQKIVEKDNALVLNFDKKTNQNDKMRSSKITITPLDDYVPPKDQESYDQIKDDSFHGEYYMKNDKVFKKQHHRIKNYDEEDIYDETIRVNVNKKKYNTNLNINTNSKYPTDLALKETERYRFIGHSPHQQYETKRHRKLGEFEEIEGESQYISGHSSKKQRLRQRAAALLQKVRSEDKLKMSYGGKKTYLYNHPHY